MYQIRKMRLPTSAEWNHLIEITGGFDSRIHWSSAWTLCQDAVEDFVSYVVRGYISSDCYSTCRGSVIDEKFGFQPAFVVSGAEEIDRDGQLVPVGALYVNGYPLRVPPEPVLGQDIPDYIFGSILEFCPGKTSPEYQIKCFKVGSVLIADRVLLKRLAWIDAPRQTFC